MSILRVSSQDIAASVETGRGSSYRADMNDAQKEALEQQLEDLIRSRLVEALAADGRSVAEIARLARMNGDLLRKFKNGARWVDFRSLAPVCAVLGIDVAWLVGGTRQMYGMSGMLHEVPIIDAGRYPMDPDPAKRAAALLDKKNQVGEAPNPTPDRGAHWVRLRERFTVKDEVYSPEDEVLLAPAHAPRTGEPAAVLTSRRFAVALHTQFAGQDVYTVNGVPIPAADCTVLGRIERHNKKTVSD
jgi:hypothetical protein